MPKRQRDPQQEKKMPVAKKPKIQSLPLSADILLYVFSYLPTEELRKCMIISRQFNNEVRNPILWEDAKNCLQELDDNISDKEDAYIAYQDNLQRLTIIVNEILNELQMQELNPAQEDYSSEQEDLNSDDVALEVQHDKKNILKLLKIFTRPVSETNKLGSQREALYSVDLIINLIKSNKKNAHFLKGNCFTLLLEDDLTDDDSQFFSLLDILSLCGAKQAHAKLRKKLEINEFSLIPNHFQLIYNLTDKKVKPYLKLLAEMSGYLISHKSDALEREQLIGDAFSQLDRLFSKEADSVIEDALESYGHVFMKYKLLTKESLNQWRTYLKSAKQHNADDQPTLCPSCSL